MGMMGGASMGMSGATGASGSSMGGHGMAMGGMEMAGGTTPAMWWTMNGKSFPETEPIFVRVGEAVKVRLINKDTGMMGQHPMEHPIHVHGTYFQVVAINGKAPEREMWKDTVNVAPNASVDIAFAIRNPGTWMLHCHILDHEDGGMMTTVVAE